ncbi:MAG: hypothetical protein MUE52_04275 [Tabrizicola sp.]|jgi:hypothetical protein|nr:hypothetical protein [Tabrizicola sp.]
MGPALFGVIHTLSPQRQSPPSKPSISQLIRAYARLLGLSVDDLTGPSKAAVISHHRHRLMYLIRQIDPTASYTLIGRYLGGRDMATVHEAVRKVGYGANADRMLADQLVETARQVVQEAHEEASTERQARPWQLLAAIQVLHDGELTDAEARKAALSFLSQLEGANG